jgi:hypothetical protein
MQGRRQHAAGCASCSLREALCAGTCAGGIVKRRYSLLGRATGCRRFGARRVDCRFVNRIAETCEIWAARLDRQGQIWVGSYGCSERGFQRRPQGRKADRIDEPLWMFGPGPTY